MPRKFSLNVPFKLNLSRDSVPFKLNKDRLIPIKFVVASEARAWLTTDYKFLRFAFTHLRAASSHRYVAVCMLELN